MAFQDMIRALIPSGAIMAPFGRRFAIHPCTYTVSYFPHRPRLPHCHPDRSRSECDGGVEGPAVLRAQGKSRFLAPEARRSEWQGLWGGAIL